MILQDIEGYELVPALNFTCRLSIPPRPAPPTCGKNENISRDLHFAVPTLLSACIRLASTNCGKGKEKRRTELYIIGANVACSAYTCVVRAHACVCVCVCACVLGVSVTCTVYIVACGGVTIQVTYLRWFEPCYTCPFNATNLQKQFVHDSPNEDDLQR